MKRFEMSAEHKAQLAKFLGVEALRGEEEIKRAQEIVKNFRECVEVLNSDDMLDEEQVKFLQELGIIVKVPTEISDILNALNEAETFEDFMESIIRDADRSLKRMKQKRTMQDIKNGCDCPACVSRRESEAAKVCNAEDKKHMS
jgi:hypothetical protein